MEESFRDKVLTVLATLAGIVLIYGGIVGALILAGTASSDAPQSAPVEREQPPPAPRQAA